MAEIKTKQNDASGREGDMPLIGFSPRKQNLVLYILDSFDQYQDLLSRLGKHKLGKVCLYLNRLADVDLAVLEEMIGRSLDKQGPQMHSENP